MQKNWTFTCDGIEHTVFYHGQKLTGTVKLTVDGVYNEYTPLFIRKIGSVVKLGMIGPNVYIHIGLTGKDVNLAVDGAYVGNPFSPIDINAAAPSVSMNGNADLQKKINSGSSSFLIFTIFTFVNLFLIMLNATISFPFSATLPQIPLIFGIGFYNAYLIPALYVIGAIISFILAGVYLVLYLLARKWDAPLYVAFALIILDTAFVIYLAVGDVSSSVIDILFHVWVIVSIFNLIKSRMQMSKLVQNELTDVTASEKEAEQHEGENE